MAQVGNELSRNPNVCASCSSMADGMGEDREDNLNEESETNRQAQPRQPTAGPSAFSPSGEVRLEWASGRIQKHE